MVRRVVYFVTVCWGLEENNWRNDDVAAKEWFGTKKYDAIEGPLLGLLGRPPSPTLSPSSFCFIASEICPGLRSPSLFAWMLSCNSAERVGRAMGKKVFDVYPSIQVSTTTDRGGHDGM